MLDLNGDDIDMEFENRNHVPNIEKQTSEKTDIVAVSGHFRYGLHNLLHDSEPKYIAFFRNPVEQYLSQYYYITSLEEYPDIKEMSLKRGNLEEFIGSDLLIYTQNTQTFFLSEAKNRLDFQSRVDYFSEQAIKEIVNSFAFCAITEHFDESLVIMREIFDWKKPMYYVKRKVNINRPKAESHDESLIRRIKEINNFDFALYENALAQFEIKKTNIKFFRMKVLIFKIQNYFYRTFHK